MIEDRKPFPLTRLAFFMIAAVLSSCGGDSGVGSSGREENRGNAISETTHSDESTGKAKAGEGGDAWYRQCLAEHISSTPQSTHTAASYGNENVVKMRRSSCGRQRYGIAMSPDMCSLKRLDRVVERVNRRYASVSFDKARRAKKGPPGVVVTELNTNVTHHPNFLSHPLPGYNFVTDAFSVNGSDWSSDVLDLVDWIDQDEWGEFGQTVWSNSWHGTCVTGAVVATMSVNGTQDHAVARDPTVDVDEPGRGRTRYVVDGMGRAAALPVTSALEDPDPEKGVKMSVGAVGACSRTSHDAIDDPVGQGVTVVAAAGNDVANEIGAPPGCRGGISVMGDEQTGRRVLGSNTHSRMSLGSQETSILTLSNTGTRVPTDASSGYMHGTSLAAPQVSGLASLILTTNPWLTPGEVASVLNRTAGCQLRRRHERAE
ncbi:S8 family serine peptidase [Burkholderia sp. AU30280]|uniref:S8 family serine peptidase n=1 Tax=Burkholderia sp. AU30280 TaxID=2879628 RepID=UPI001CF16F5D|nr:S8 family serine peptidase [Burkholderia sp. AU30280]MCA8273598.1 S8 family serine peptidase [Burkholderia sp. AU30280]